MRFTLIVISKYLLRNKITPVCTTVKFKDKYFSIQMDDGFIMARFSILSSIRLLIKEGEFNGIYSIEELFNYDKFLKK